MSLVAHRFELVEFWIFVVVFYRQAQLWNFFIKFFKLWNSTRPNWWATKNIHFQLTKIENVDFGDCDFNLMTIQNCRIVVNWNHANRYFVERGTIFSDFLFQMSYSHMKNFNGTFKEHHIQRKLLFTIIYWFPWPNNPQKWKHILKILYLSNTKIS